LDNKAVPVKTIQVSTDAI
jgi:hypothetical protein